MSSAADYVGANAINFTESRSHVRVDLIAAHVTQVLSDQANRLAPRPINTVLDVGCGTGRFTELCRTIFPNPDTRIVGFDFAPDLIHTARSRVGAQTNHITYLQHDLLQPLDAAAQNLPSTYDIILSVFCVCHFGTREDMHTAMRHMLQMLHPEHGTLVLVIPRIPTNESEQRVLAKYGVQYPGIDHVHLRTVANNAANGAPVTVHLSTRQPLAATDTSSPAAAVLHDYYWPPAAYEAMLREVGFRGDITFAPRPLPHSLWRCTASTDNTAASTVMISSRTQHNVSHTMSLAEPPRIPADNDTQEQQQDRVVDILLSDYYLAAPSYYIIIARSNPPAE